MLLLFYQNKAARGGRYAVWVWGRTGGCIRIVLDDEPLGQTHRGEPGRLFGWEALDRGLRAHGMGVAGSLGPLAGKIFRIGHMGAQADMVLVERGMDVLAQVLALLQ